MSAMTQDVLIEEHGLTASDLPEVGTAEDVTALIEGKHELHVGQIRALASRFHVSPAVFI